MAIPRLKIVMAEKNIKNKELAEKTGFSHQYISELRTNDRVNPRLSIIQRIAEGLGVHPRELF